MAKFNPKVLDSDVHRKQGSAVPVTTQSTFSESLSPKAITKGGLPLRLDSNINAFKQEDRKPTSGFKPGAQPGMRSQVALKCLSDVSKAPQTEKERSSICTVGSIPLLTNTGGHQGFPDTLWPCQDSAPGPSSKTEALRQNLMLKLQPVSSGNWKNYQVPGVRYPVSQRKETADKDLIIPKQRTLPSMTGPMPVKPRRPPRVNLQRYQRETETRSVTSSVLPLVVQPHAHHVFIPLSPEDIQNAHLQIVKNNRQPMCQQQEQNEYDDVEPVGIVGKKLKGLNIHPPIPPFKPDSMLEEEMYDDITVIPNEFPDPPPEFSIIYDDVGNTGTATTNSQRTAHSVGQSIRIQNCMVELISSNSRLPTPSYISNTLRPAISIRKVGIRSFGLSVVFN